jgi:hypothetical protein
MNKKKKKGLANVLTAPAHLNPDIPIWRGAQLDSNGVRHYSNPQHGGVMGLSLYQPLGHRPSWQFLDHN